VELPPIDLIRVGDIYFVRDGHHRISVVRALGLQEIAAKEASSLYTTCSAARPIKLLEER